MRTEEYHHWATIREFDEQNPDAGFYRDRLNWHKPSFLAPIPAHLLFKGDERTHAEQEIEQREYLKKHGIDF